MSAYGIGRVKTRTLTVRVEVFFRNFASSKQIIFETYRWMPCWRIVFSTCSECMSFHTAKTRSGHWQCEGGSPTAMIAF